jgi:hypothetical protein
VPDALEHTTVSRAKRRNVSGAPQVGRHSIRVNCNLNGSRAVLGAYTSSDAKPLVGIDGHRERRPKFLGVRLGLLRKIELIGALTRESEADPAARFTDHEVDQLGRDELRGANEIAFVLAILVVRDDDKLAGFDIGNGLLDCSELHIL